MFIISIWGGGNVLYFKQRAAEPDKNVIFFYENKYTR